MRLVAGWNRFWFAPGRAEDLAVSRALFAAGLFFFSFSRPIHEWGGVPAAYLRPAEFFSLFGVPVVSREVLYLAEVAWRAAMLSLTLGLFARTSAAFVTLGSVYLFGLDAPEILGRSYTPAVFVPAILACSRCGDVWSIDSWWRRRRAGGRVEAGPPAEYGWPATLVCAFLSYTFFAAGVSKIRQTGFPDWMLSDMSYRTLLVGNYWYASRDMAPLPVGPTLLRLHEGVGLVVGVLTQLTELFYPLALVARWARLTLVPLMLLILAGIAVAMGPFFALTMLAHVFWVPWTRVGRLVPKL